MFADGEAVRRSAPLAPKKRPPLAADPAVVPSPSEGAEPRAMIGGVPRDGDEGLQIAIALSLLELHGRLQRASRRTRRSRP
jgi:hypothetical protein